MRALADFTIQPGDAGTEEAGGATLAFSGEMLVSSVGAIDARLRALDEPIARIDISAWNAWTRWARGRCGAWRGTGRGDRRRQQRSRAPDRRGGPGGENDRASAPRACRCSSACRARWAMRWSGWPGALQVLGFLGQVVQAPARCCGIPAFPRQGDGAPDGAGGRERAGIIGLMSFLVGIVIAQQGAVQLRSSARKSTRSTWSAADLRELGILMTAIMVAGRSGSPSPRRSAR
jgi:phospholipid/cholesterol/gamma-HCH transport system permease protein